ncbi:hypothetical protein RclHR1_39830001, partial [Rhizophagus clarus]
FGNSENAILDHFILKKCLKWIPYNQFENVEYLDKGGFGTIYKAFWKNEGIKIVFKCPDKLNENLDEFLNEWDCHEKCLQSNAIIYLHGFTKKPDTSNPDTSTYMVVMDYASEGNLRGSLTKIIENNWNQKLFMLLKIISGLKQIHKQKLIHRDFHDGNILKDGKSGVYISDLGLCQPVKSFLKTNNIYGVIPFMAPEVLRGKPYTPASDIYSFSMIMWEFTSGVSPFNGIAHDFQLSVSICKGERPEIIENTPQCYVDLMKRCWNEDPLKRPSSEEIEETIKSWIFRPYDDDWKEISSDKISKELKSNIMEFINAPIGNNNLITESHPQAYYTSRLLDFTSKEVNEILESKCLDCIVEDSIKSLSM